MLEPIFQFILHFVKLFGYKGVFVLMVLESCGIPIPSEIIVPFSGYLAVLNIFNISIVILITTLANVVGSIILYYIGKTKGRDAFLSYGKFVGLKKKHLLKAEKWFELHGEITVLVGRILPAVRTYISLPAGIAQMKLHKFILYTVIGSFVWNTFLAYTGVWLGLNWILIEKYIDIIGLIAAVVFVLYLWEKIK